jgi:methylglyoxal synthase
MLLRVCDVHNVPIATNEATAQIIESYRIAIIEISTFTFFGKQAT